MGAAIDTPSSGGKRKLDAHLHLVPYVDLLMTIMAFLVLTAAWTATSVLEVQQQTSAATPPTTTVEPPTTLSLSLQAHTVDVTDGGVVVASLDVADRAALEALLQALPKKARQTEVHVGDGVDYGVVVSIVDVVTAAVGGPISLSS